MFNTIAALRKLAQDTLEPKPGTSTFYAGKGQMSQPPHEIYYSDFYKDPRGVAASGHEKDKIVQVEVSPDKQEKSQYWGWWDFEKNDYAHIYPSKTSYFNFDLKEFGFDLFIGPVWISIGFM